MKNDTGMMRACSLFKGIEEENLTEIIRCLGVRQMTYPMGSLVLAEGDRASSLGVVLDGFLQVLRVDYYGNRSIMAKLRPGDIFAETIACAGIAHMPVSVTAETEARVMLIEAERLMRPCGQGCPFHHQLMANLIQVLAAKNLVCQQKIEVTSKRSTRDKLMAYLLLQAKTAGSSTFAIPYNRQELADYLEVDRSGLSAEISKLRREGVLASHRSEFTLL